MPIPFNIAGHINSQISAAPPVTTLKNGLISVWEMNEISGTSVIDAGPNNYHLANYGPTIKAAGIVEGSNAYNYDGTNDYLRHSISDNRFTPSSGGSYSCWFRRDSGENTANQSTHYLMSKVYWATGFKVFRFTLVQASHETVKNRLYYSYWDTSDVETSVAYNINGADIWTGNWAHGVATRDGADIKLYVNGALVDSNTGGSGIGEQTSSTNVHMCIGAIWKSTLSPDLWFPGSIDQTGIWNRALTQEEVTELYQGGSGLEYINWL